MSLEPSHVKRHVQQRLAELKRTAAAKRERSVQAERDYEPFLSGIAVPVFTAVAQSLSAEGHPYRVLTPGRSVRLASDRSAHTWAELRLDTSGPSPAVVLEINRERGHRVQTDERQVADGNRIASLTDEQVLALLVEAIGDLVER